MCCVGSEAFKRLTCCYTLKFQLQSFTFVYVLIKFVTKVLKFNMLALTALKLSVILYMLLQITCPSVS